MTAARRKVPSLVWTLLKVAVAAGVVALMFHKDMIRLEDLRRGAAQWPLLVASLFAILGVLFIQSQRWGALLRAQDIHIRPWPLYGLMMTGFFFNVVAPGGLGGDAVKAFLVARGQTKKAAAATTVFLDRFLGLATLLFVSCVVIALDFDRLWNAPLERLSAFGLPGGRVLVLAIVLCLGSMVAVALLLMSRRVRRSAVFRACARIVPFRATVKNVYEAMHVYRSHPRMLTGAAVASLVAQAPLFVIYYAYGLAVGADIEFWHCALIVPPAMVIRVLPLLPGGAGQGVIAMGLLFPIVGVQEGGAIGALGDAIFMIAYLCGGFFFLFGKASYREMRTVAETAHDDQ